MEISPEDEEDDVNSAYIEEIPQKNKCGSGTDDVDATSTSKLNTFKPKHVDTTPE